ncbi:hypothetical protein EJ06DRAFT_530906 [Trichodelitschia bisporula]|uniref:Uncharacterized protein n=1 Tax=Trichodelitschia bisporula TaxID=703511 RepID=A0A6G1HU04_9PEZI|nr:hypothetical protein EJ06DRAFT_530906 [Trichodelitschia bisporula]
MAEQDTYTKNIGSAVHKAADAAANALNIGTSGLGHDGTARLHAAPRAEQEVLGSHFNTGTTFNPGAGVKQAVENAASGLRAEQDVHQSHFGMGHDGQGRMKEFAAHKGMGAEQDRYESHFGAGRVEEGIKNKVNKMGGALQDSVESNKGASHMG